MDNIDDPKSTAPQSTEDGDPSNRPQDELEIEIVADVFFVVGLADGHGEDSVGDHPRYDHVGSDGGVVIFLLLGFRHAVLGHFKAVAEIAESFVVARVDVELLTRHLQFDCVVLA